MHLGFDEVFRCYTEYKLRDENFTVGISERGFVTS